MSNLTDIYESMRMPLTYLSEEAMADLTVKFHDDLKPKKLSLPDTYARKVLGYANTLAENADEVMKAWVSKSGWSVTAQKAILPYLYDIFKMSFNLEDIRITQQIIRAIKDLTEKKNTLTSMTEALSNDDDNLVLFLQRTKVQIESSKILIDNKNFINSIKLCKFPESTVSVGDGELLMTLFSEATNPSEGDLDVNGIPVEVKGNGGRAGKGDVVQAANHVFKKIEKDLKSELPQIKQNIINELITIAQPLSNILFDKIIPIKGSTVYLKYIEMIKTVLDGDIKKIDKLITSLNINDLIKAGNKIYINNENIINMPLEEYERINETIKNVIKKYGAAKIDGVSVNFNTYFNNPIKNDDILDTLSQFSAIKQPTVKQIIGPYYYNEELTPEQIVVAIQIANYQMQVKERFKYIIYFNKYTNNMVLFGEYTNNFEYNLKMTLDKAHLFKVIGKATGGVGTTGGRGGFTATV